MAPLPGHRTQLASFPRVHTWRDQERKPPWRYAEWKLDGRRVILAKDRDERVTLRGRQEHIDHWPQARHLDGLEATARALPTDSAVACEAHVPGCNASGQVPAAMARGEGWQLTVLVPLFWDGKLVTVWTDGHLRRTVMDVLGLDLPPLAALDPTWSRDDLLAAVGDAGAEGLVLKQSPFFGWWKLKPELTADFVVLDVYEGTSRNEGRAGGLVVGLSNGTEVCRVGTGLTDEDRETMWASRADLPGSVVEVVYERRAANGSLLFPRFVRARPDKPASECDGRDL